MEMLFNKELYSVDIPSLSLSLLNSTLDDVTIEDEIISNIEAMQSSSAEFLDLAEAYAVEIYKNSSRDIYTGKNNVLFDSSIPSVISRSYVDISISESSNIQGLLRKSNIDMVFSLYFWKFGTTVQVKNNMYSNSNLEPGTDLLMTSEASEYYFLEKKDIQELYFCRTARLSAIGISFDNIDSSFVLCEYDLFSNFYKQDDVISAENNKLISGSTEITKHTLLDEKIICSGKTQFSSIICESGVTTKAMRDSLFISRAIPFISNNAILNPEAESNARSVYSVSSEFFNTLAPYKGWSPTELKKTEYKDSSFLESFTDLLLDGNSVPDSDMNAYRSVVSKKELNSILTILVDKIINLDICNDD